MHVFGFIIVTIIIYKYKPKGRVSVALLNRDYLLSLGIEFIINYLRKSRADEEQERRTGEDVLTAQKELMDRILEPVGLPYDQRPEIGSGDKISSRPVFQSVIEDLQAKKYQAIAVKEISRMGRGSYTDMGVIYDLIVDNRIFIITPYKVYDPRNPSDLRQIRFELFMSREEFETTRERLFGGRVNNAIEGRWVSGAAPYGFTYNKATKKLEIDEEQAREVRAIFDFFVNGVVEPGGHRRDVSYRALASYLSKKTSIKPPRGKGDWQPQVLRQLLSNERYIGIMRFRTTQRINGKVVARPEEEHIIIPGAIPAILDEDIWEKAQKKINDSSHKPRTKMDFSPCELAGLCICTKCGRRMVRQYSIQDYKKKTGEVIKYHKEFLWCTTSGCTFIKYRNVEEEIISVLSYLSDLDEDELNNTFSSILASEQKSTEIAYDDEYIEKQTKTLKKRMDFIFEKYESGKYTDEMFDERKSEVDKQLEDLKKLKESFEEQAARVGENNVDTDLIRKNINTVLDQYHATDNKTMKNSILRATFDSIEVTLTEKGRGRIPAKFDLTVNLKANLTKLNFLVL
ncbi:Recombinase [compost metagenome]